MLIGLSISRCIADIISGAVGIEEVAMIHARTSCADDNAWNKVIWEYQFRFWHHNPEEGERVLRQLLADGKILQPRLVDGRMPAIEYTGHWVEDESKIEYEREFA